MSRECRARCIQSEPRRLAVFGLTAGLLGGGAAGLALTGTTLASAQTSDVTGTVSDPAAPAPSSGSPAAPKNDWAKSVLDGLVAKGSISQAQADEILAALQAARPAHGPGGHGFGGPLPAGAPANGSSGSGTSGTTTTS